MRPSAAPRPRRTRAIALGAASVVGLLLGVSGQLPVAVGTARAAGAAAARPVVCGTSTTTTSADDPGSTAAAAGAQPAAAIRPVLRASSNRVVAGTAVTISADAAGAPFGAAVSFFDDGEPLVAAVPFVHGTASIVTAQLRPGTHDITAVSSGSTPSDAVGGLVVEVEPPPSGATTVGLDATPSRTVAIGHDVSLVAGVFPDDASGSVQFFDRGVPVGASVTVAAGGAELRVRSVHRGSHFYSARFTPLDYPRRGSVSSRVLVSVVGQPLVPVVSLELGTLRAAGPNVVVPVTLAIAPRSAQGTFALLDNGRVVNKGVIIGGTWSWSLPGLAVGTHVIQAQLVPDDDARYLPSRSAALTVLVAGAVAPQPVVATLRVSAASPAAQPRFSVSLSRAAAGTVTILDGSRSVAVARATRGRAVGSLPALAGMSHRFSACFVPSDPALFPVLTNAVVLGGNAPAGRASPAVRTPSHVTPSTSATMPAAGSLAPGGAGHDGGTAGPATTLLLAPLASTTSVVRGHLSATVAVALLVTLLAGAAGTLGAARRRVAPATSAGRHRNGRGRHS